MQIQGELQARDAAGTPAVRRGMFLTAKGIIRDEGLFRLWSGLPPALYRHMIYSGIRMGLYEKLRDDVLGKNPDGTFPIYKVRKAADH
jgi:solute carrier family 25 uncoupling protein 27